MIAFRAHLDNSVQFPHLKTLILIISSKILFPYKLLQRLRFDIFKGNYFIFKGTLLVYSLFRCTAEWVSYICTHVCVCVCAWACALSHVWLFVTPWTVARLLCPWNFRQEYWTGLPFPCPLFFGFFSHIAKTIFLRLL